MPSCWTKKAIVTARVKVDKFGELHLSGREAIDLFDRLQRAEEALARLCDVAEDVPKKQLRLVFALDNAKKTLASRNV